MAKINFNISASLFLSVLLCGCATTTLWDKPGATQQDFAQDRYRCQQETASSGNYTAAGSLMFIAIAQSQARKNQQAMFSSCMEAAGYVAEK